MSIHRDSPVRATGSNPDLNDYFDADLPPPHRLSGVDDPYAFASPRPSGHNTARSSYLNVSHSESANMPLNEGYSNMEEPYGNAAYSSSAWLEKEQARSRRSKWVVVGSLLALLGLIAAGVAIGVTVSRNKSKTSSNLSSSSSGSASVVNQTNPNDPSTFQLDSRLKKSFYGLAYTPAGSQYPACGNSLADVIEDIQLISQLTPRIRLYGADCNQSALVLEAIKQTKVDLKVYLANYPIPTNSTPYTRQRDAIIEAIQTYGTDNILGVTVGNEFILNYVTAAGVSDPNSAIGNEGGQLLLANITDTRNALAALNLNQTMPVGNADAGSFFNNEVLAAVDYGMSNVHPWFANVSIDQAAAWTNEFFQENNVIVANQLANKPTMYIAETGWPSNSSDVSNMSNGPSTASEPNLQTFLDTFVCQANQNGTGYFFFEYFDEVWKDIEFGGVEGWWGLFYSNKTLKNIQIPDCLVS
ncbi:putative glucan endo-1,3-beta-glucosidase btgC [Grifola frondosa]|uniref:glucan endo-1,3-beta-D-glucosidase n=1 Tax=Grifola frondosa TaxID=5627 RepID=A0A1C7MAH1_GRIFR|nr:putative glucan endo-1,3-beta-glucosidase btgC [Grifola frondosa]